jgi:hypothetical protein
VLLAVVIALAMLPGVGWADDDDKKNDSHSNDNKTEKSKPDKPSAGAGPDLKIEYVGFNAPGVNDQLVKFKITNVGKGPSTAVKARVVTSSPEPTPWLREIDVPVLSPGASAEIFYPLAASCNGHLLRALVNAPGDTNSANNFVEATACPALPPIVPQSPPPVDPSVDYGNSVNDGLPPHLRSGPHTLTYRPAAMAVFGQVHRDNEPLSDGCLDGLPTPYDGRLTAGFLNADLSGPFGCTLNIVWQAGFRFDLSQLREARDKRHWLPTDAVLRFKETPWSSGVDQPPDQAYHWANGEGEYLPTKTCWPRLAVPTVDWSGPDRGTLPNDVVREAEEIGRWTVFDQMLGMVVDPDREQKGFLILGHSESMDQNNAICRSRIDDVTLTVTYTIP